MERLDFASVMAVLRRNIPDENLGNQADFLHSLFLDVNLQPQSAIEFDQGQVCRWINGLARLSPNIISFYQDNLNQRSGTMKDNVKSWEKCKKSDSELSNDAVIIWKLSIGKSPLFPGSRAEKYLRKTGGFL